MCAQSRLLYEIYYPPAAKLGADKIRRRRSRQLRAIIDGEENLLIMTNASILWQLRFQSTMKKPFLSDKFVLAILCRLLRRQTQDSRCLVVSKRSYTLSNPITSLFCMTI